MSTGGPVLSNGMMERFLRAFEDQSRASGQLAALQTHANERLEAVEQEARVQTAVLKTLAEALIRMDQDARQGREKAVTDVKSHVETIVTRELRNWRIWVAAALIALSNLLSVGVPRILELLKAG